MQIFIPCEQGFRESLEALDYKRLGSQRREAATVIRMLENPIRQNKRGEMYELPWLKSPLAHMWKDYVPALKEYYNIALTLWAERGYRNIILTPHVINETIIMPVWWGSEVHAAHQQMLYLKKPDFYIQWAAVYTTHSIYAVSRIKQ